MAMPSLSQEMLQYFTQLNEAQRKSVVELIKSFLQPNADSLSQNLDAYNDEIKRADSEIENGSFFTHEEVKKRHLR